MYRLLAHLADPSGWSAADTHHDSDARSTYASATHGNAAGTQHASREHGSTFRAPPPRLHETR